MSARSELPPDQEIARINRRISILFQRGLKIKMGLLLMAARASEGDWTEERYRAERRGPVARLDASRRELIDLTWRLDELSRKKP